MVATSVALLADVITAPQEADPVRSAAVTLLVPITAAVLMMTAGGPSASADPDPTAPPAEPSSLWVWSPVRPATLVPFAVENGFDRLYVFVSSAPDREEKSRLHRLGALATDAGVELWALSGEPRWAMHPTDAIGWQRAALKIGIFAGTHLDVEPYSLPAWETDQGRVVRSYLDMLDRVQAGSALPLHIDVPFWYDTIPSGADTLADDVLDRVDGVTVMSYRDTATGPNSLWAVARDLVRRADTAGVPVELAVETNPLDDCPYCTFHEEGRAALDDVIGTVDAIAREHPSYDGFAVHDYDGFAALGP